MAERPLNQMNFSGGMNTLSAPLLVKRDEAEIIRNYHLDTLGALTKRPGFWYFGDDFVGAGSQTTGEIVNLYNHIATSSANNKFLLSRNDVLESMVTTTLNGAVAIGATSIVLTDATNFDTAGRIEVNGDVINYTGKSSNTLTGVTGVEKAHASGDTVRQWTLEAAGSSGTGRVRFVTFLDNTFDMNAGRAVRGYQFGASVSVTTIGNNSTLGEVFQDRLYHSGLSTAPSRLFFSSLPNGSSNITWDTTNDYVDINPDDGDKITALKTGGTRLLVFKRYAVYTWKFGQTQADKIFDVGTPAQETVQNKHGITFFANENGVYAWNFGSEAQPRLISRKVQKWVDAISTATLESTTQGLAGGIDNNHYYLWIGDVTVDSRSYTNVVLVYHIFLDAWTVYTGVPARAWATFLSGNDLLTCFARGGTSNNTSTFRFNKDATADPGTTVAADIAGIPIDAEVLGREHLMSYPEESDLHTIHTVMSQAVGTNVFYSVNREDMKPQLGETNKRFSNFRAKGKGNSVRIKFEDNSKFRSIIEGYYIEYEPRPTIKRE